MKKVFLYSFLLVLTDQIVKLLIVNMLKINETIVVIKDFLNITYVTNTGASFGILKNQTYALIIVSIVALFFIYKYLLKGKTLNKLELIAYSLLISGIVGNLIDRVARFYVVDYIDVYIFGYNFPVFNFADICMVLSVAMLLIGGRNGNNK